MTRDMFLADDGALILTRHPSAWLGYASELHWREDGTILARQIERSANHAIAQGQTDLSLGFYDGGIALLRSVGAFPHIDMTGRNAHRDDVPRLFITFDPA